jgi:hypothetical protein
MGQPPRFNVTVINASPQFRILGCLGCLFAIFVLGGFIGVLLFGWKTLLGM